MDLTKGEQELLEREIIGEHINDLLRDVLLPIAERVVAASNILSDKQHGAVRLNDNDTAIKVSSEYFVVNSLGQPCKRVASLAVRVNKKTRELSASGDLIDGRGQQNIAKVNIHANTEARSLEFQEGQSIHRINALQAMDLLIKDRFLDRTAKLSLTQAEARTPTASYSQWS
jgi:hypothetical protein